MGKELKVALIQSPLFWEDPERNRDLFSEKIRNVSGDTDLIVLPEMFTSGFTMHPENIAFDEGIKTIQWMRAKATEKDAALVGSIALKEDDRYFNRLCFVEPDGSLHTYNKRHTFTLAGEDQVYTAGEEKLIVAYKGFILCPLICYDLRFPVWSRNTEDYDVLLYVANWPRKRITAWDALLKARAIENMAYCIGVNRIGEDGGGYLYSGHSAVYDSLGEQLVFSDEESVLYVTLEKDHIQSTRDTLRFLEDRDSFSLK